MEGIVTFMAGIVTFMADIVTFMAGSCAWPRLSAESSVLPYNWTVDVLASSWQSEY